MKKFRTSTHRTWDEQSDAEARKAGREFSYRPHHNDDGSVNYGMACMACKTILGGMLIPDECPNCGVPFRERLEPR